MGKIEDKTPYMGRIDKTPSNSPSMGRIDTLINELCPEGVEFVKLGDVAKLSRGKVISKNYLRDNPGDYPVYSSQTANNGELGKINTYDYNGCYLTWTTDGAYAGTIFKREGKFNITNVCGLIDIIDSRLDIYFAYYWLSIAAKSYVYEGMGNPKLMSNVMATVLIPLPPLPIQEAIVEILDNFSRLSAELQARKQQYAYYRNQLLTRFAPDEPVREYALGELGTFSRGNGLQKCDLRESGFPCIHYGQVHTFYKTFVDNTLSFCESEYGAKLKQASYGNLIIATTSEDVEACCKAVAWIGENNVAVSGDAYIYAHSQNPKYMAYLFQTEMFSQQKRKAANGAKVIRVSGDAMAKFKFPFPSLQEQARIVSILDKFEALINDLSQGLPAEIEAVQKQYEYYRNKLLTFETKSL